MARPEKWKDSFLVVARGAAQLGATDREIAEMLAVTERTLNNWKHTHPELEEALKVGKETADARVEQSLYRRALGYSHDEVHITAYEGDVTQTPIVKHYAPDTTAAIFWLKNRKPAEWRDVKAQEISAPGGKPLVTLIQLIGPEEK